MPICVDASVAVKWLVAEPGSMEALRLLEEWRSETLVAPSLMPAEVASVLRKKVLRGDLTLDEGERALEVLAGFGFDLRLDDRLVRAAWKLAARFDQPTVYDALYLAVAEAAGAEFWTADHALAAGLGGALPYVRLLPAPA